jgi:hypothetical protein
MLTLTGVGTCFDARLTRRVVPRAFSAASAVGGAFAVMAATTIALANPRRFTIAPSLDTVVFRPQIQKVGVGVTARDRSRLSAGAGATGNSAAGAGAA